MYVCVCNALKEAEARRVAPACVAEHEIYGQLGCAPQCGRCIPQMRAILMEECVATMAPQSVDVPCIVAAE